MSRFSILPEKTLVPIAASASVLTFCPAAAHIRLVAELAAIVVFGLIAWASWVGYVQNRGLDDEWPVNLAIFGASVPGIAGLAVSIVI